MKSLISFLLLLLAAVAQAVSSTGGRLLAVLDDVADKASYSKLLGSLESRGFDITYETPKSESLKLFNLGEKTYDHVILFPIKTKGLGPNLAPKILVDFVNANGNVLVALSSEIATSTSIVGFLNELDISLPADRTGLVVDHFNYDAVSAADKHDVVLLPAVQAKLRAGVRDFFSTDDKAVLAFPRGVGQVLGAGALLAPVVRAPATAYSYNPREDIEAVDDVFAAGAQLSLVSTFQARNSARVAVVGSAEMLSDQWFGAKVKRAGEKKEVAAANEEFAKRISGWAFQEIGVLRVNSIEHHLNEAGASNASNPKIYRIKNDVIYTIALSEYTWDKWTAFAVPAGDELQLEFSMLSPFHRLDLSPVPAESTPESAAYRAAFKLPDQHGIFNFLVNYKRPFLSNLEEKVTVSVRHMAHNEWPRSWAISGAWPWIAGIGATAAGFVAFCAVWMYSAPGGRGSAGAKKTQ